MLVSPKKEGDMFEISLSKSEWLKILGVIVNITDRKQIIPTLSFILVQKKGSSLLFTGSDIETEITVNISNFNSIDSDFSFLLPGRIFYDICSLSSDGEIYVKVDNENKIVINAQSSNYQLVGLNPKEFPVYRENQNGYLWQMNLYGKQIKRLIKKTAFAADDQNVRQYLKGLMFTVQDNQVRVVATDSHRLAFAKENLLSGGINGLQAFVLPKKAALELQRIFSDEDEILIQVTENYLKLSANNLIIFTKLIGGKFPDYYKLIFGEKGNFITLSTSALLQAINKVGILVDEKLRLIKLSISQQKLVVDSDTENQEANDFLPLEYQGEELDIMLNLEYLRETIKQIDTEQVNIYFKDSKQAVIFEPSDDSGIVYIIMPVVK